MPSRLIERIGAMALAALTSFIAVPAWAWGPEGHSIVAEIAQRRLTRDAPAIMSKIQSILGPGVSMASIASWADDYRVDHPETEFWHFVDIPIKVNDYDPAKVCEASDEGDCIVAELDRLKREVRCAKGDQQQQALKFAIHFVGDIHQPLHTVAEEEGGLDLRVHVRMHGECKNCPDLPVEDNLHVVWDSTLIKKTVRSWGSYVSRLEAGWLTSPDAQKPVIDDPAQWAVETHKTAQKIWALTPRNRSRIPNLKDHYYVKVLPILDQQLGLAALRLTLFLTDALSSEDCALK
jgi:hypothetical protein